jgi:cell division transport system permease protein
MVEDVDYESDVINKFVNLFDLFIWIALGLAVLSILVSSIVIGSTISLSIASRIEEIEVMSFVGASPGTILGPFIIEGVFYGLIGGGISAAGIYFGWKYLQTIFQTNLPWFNLSIGQTIFYSIVAGTVVFGFLTGLITSWLSSRNTLRRIRA